MTQKWISIPCGTPDKPNLELAKVLILRAKELGFTSNTMSESDIANGTLALPIKSCGWSNQIMSDNDIEYCKTHLCNERMIGDIHKFLFTDEYCYEPKSPIQVKLNDTYIADVTDKEIKVGCTTFSVEKLQQLVKAVKEYNNS